MSKINTLGRTVTGKTPSTKEPEYWGDEVPFYTPEDIAKGYVLGDALRHISNKGFDSIRNNTTDGISVLVGCIGSDMGNVAIVEGRCAFNQQINALTNFESDVNPFYVYYYLSTKKAYLRQLAGSTATPLLPKSDFELIDVLKPEKHIQDTIVRVLKPIDEKILLNNAICTDLESIAKLLYDYWFVQFDFPDENGKPYKSSGGKMVWKEELKRAIPEGWEVRPLGEFISYSKNGDWGNDAPKKNNDIQVNCFRGADFPSITDNYQVTAPVRYINANNADRLLADGDLVTEISGGSPTQSTGRIGYINQKFLKRNGGMMVCSNFCKAFTPVKQSYQYWLYQTWKSLYDTGAMFNYESKTTGIKNLMFDEFIKWVCVPTPTEDLMNRYQTICSVYYGKTQDLFIESTELASLRDFLLPMLMNGQVKVEKANCSK